MKRFLGFLFVCFWAFSFAQQDSLNTEERIISFHSDIVVNAKGGIQVSEHIKVYATGNTIRRGIFRTLPETRNLNNKTQKVRYTDISVTKNGEPEDYHTETSNGNLVIYVGKKDVFLTPDVYDYVINYSTKNQIGFFPKYDEFYWNVNGLNWDFTTENISADIKLPQGAKILQNSCYTGKYGEKGDDCTFQKISDNEISFSAKNFTYNEGLTVAVGFQKGIILPPPPPTFLEKYGILITATLFLIGLFLYFFRSWDKYGRDPETPTVYPQFSPPNDLSPASFGYLKKERFDNSFVTAGVVNLAIKGFLKITENEDGGVFGLFKQKKYTLTKIKESEESLPAEEQQILEKLFRESDVVTLDNTYDSNIEKMVKSVSASLSFAHDAFINKGNNQNKLILPALAVLAFYGLGLMVSYFLDPDSGKVVLGGVIFVVLMVVFFIVQFFGKFKFSFKLFWFVPFAFFFLSGLGLKVGLTSLDDQNFNYCYIFLMVAFSGLIIYSYLIRQPTVEKLTQKSLIDGFEMYLSAAENEVMKFHNPPQMTPEIFEKYLPFAMVLGVDDIWGKKFESMLQSMNTPYQNNWYIGGSFQNMAFANSFSSSMTNSLSSAATPPSSSGSGSGGGGFSGGGGGGGGGGGW
ncbi:Predicted membrane protein [Halpernia humi]|uniref:Predicted membrane protein n=1 Tax=Halpernia humi TaxID=493375 RepID=A0A1H5Z6F3_9FLAO|nr:DUF2207 domain-containing protein [Halpernia humi]SEG31968.1 Predicted membrane protein [Halpernia humi]